MKSFKEYIAYPYGLWMLIFIAVPLLVVIWFSFLSNPDFKAGIYTFTLNNYQEFIDPVYLELLYRSFLYAVIATLICFFIAYPLGNLIVSLPAHRQNLMIVLMIIPMWVNFLLRTYAWMVLLSGSGLIAQFLGLLGFRDVSLLYTQSAVILGMVYNFFPYMLLPIYTSLKKIDPDLLRAATDLGANHFQMFVKIKLPLSLPGIVSGSMMVFMPAVSTFVISNLLGGGKYMLIGNLIEQQFLTLNNWNFGSALSMVLMTIIFLVLGLARLITGKELDTGGQIL
ncbi:ABC transporter permease [uncultured Acetobacterium sp.]|uniref:ABC transporter permease n=1 Tax=uncultured Acetobacterium sp. TaxID=217139 RepID=UPI0024278103|nr:ABC transporter permease [uncultured Acetobacterium sp.]MBU4539927.1 ABC transporter permease [Bacillota bacterium]